MASLLNQAQCRTLPGGHPSFLVTLSTPCNCNVLWQGVSQLCCPLHEKALHFLCSELAPYLSLLMVPSFTGRDEDLAAPIPFLPHTHEYVYHYYIALFPSCVFAMLKYPSLFEYSTCGSNFILFFICFAFL